MVLCKCQITGCYRFEFTCNDMKCTEESKVCNGVSDCSDGSDERFCGKELKSNQSYLKRSRNTTN